MKTTLARTSIPTWKRIFNAIIAHTVTVQTAEFETTSSILVDNRSDDKQPVVSAVGEAAPQDTEQDDYRPAARRRFGPTYDRPVAPQDTEQNDYYLWHATRWHHSEAVTMTTDLCQDWIDFWQTDTTFFVLRFPDLEATPPYTASYKLPVAFWGTYSPTLTLVQHGVPPTHIVTVPLEYRPYYHTFLHNELPSAPGERWLALGGVTTPTIECPPV